LVVADNCSDRTAAVARELGATVVERHNTDQRGKGYALDCGVRYLAREGPPAMVVIVDADCQVHAGALDRLARACAAWQRPVQARDMMQRPPGVSGVHTQVAEFAWIVRNYVRPLGLHQLGLPCPLAGTGMAFPWAAIERVPLATANLSEDLQLGVDLTLQGMAPGYVPDALVTSTFPESVEGRKTQRVRWEHGHLDTLRRGVPRLMAAALRHRDPTAFALALDLAVPPLALLVLLLCAVTAVAASSRIMGGALWPLAASGAALTAVVVGVLSSWWFFGRHAVSASCLLAAPWYALRKIPLYLTFLLARQTEWVRSRRDGES
jgi:cellulose synthase/poly-beta-1,6-N-acetylglucosamine synthase-like glycosyltransferase